MRMLSNIQKYMQHILLASGLIAMMLFSYNNTTNWHFHKLENGSIVKHAHPYQKGTNPDSPFQKHQHSGKELFFLQFLSQFITLAITAFTSLIIFRVTPFQKHQHSGKEFFFLQFLSQFIALTITAFAALIFFRVPVSIIRMHNVSGIIQLQLQLIRLWRAPPVKMNMSC